jgi:hypothetical protein
MADTTTPKPATPASPKSGFLTSEFFLVVADIIAKALGIIHVPGNVDTILIGLYTFARTLLKIFYPKFAIPAWLQKIIDELTAQAPSTPTT